MEYIDGAPLYDFIKTNKYRTHFVQDLANRLYNANNILLEKNIAHRDITTSNILVVDKEHFSLIDFGMISQTDTDNLTELEKEFFDEELKEIIGTTIPLNDTAILPKYWRIITLFEIRRVINDVVVKKHRINFKDIKIYINLDYEIRMLATNNKKLISALFTAKELLKLFRRIIFRMTYFKK